jgi:hypothetical protein
LNSNSLCHCERSEAIPGGQLLVRPEIASSRDALLAMTSFLSFELMSSTSSETALADIRRIGNGVRHSPLHPSDRPAADMRVTPSGSRRFLFATDPDGR